MGRMSMKGIERACKMKTNTRQSKLTTLLASVVTVTCFCCFAEDTPSCKPFWFQGYSTGGTLHLLKWGRATDEVVKTISLTRGETASSLATRCPDLIANDQAKICAYEYASMPATGGTENALGIPQAPRHLTYGRDRDTDQVVLRWKNTGTAYDEIRLAGNLGEVVSGTAESWNYTQWLLAIQRGEASIELGGSLSLRLPGQSFSFAVVGVRNNVYSNAGDIFVCLNGKCFRQFDNFYVPFSFGVARNWAPWHFRGETEGIQNVQSVRKGPDLPFELTKPFLERAPFAQITRVRKANSEGGVYRVFVGLEVGHVYRITMRLNTLNMHNIAAAWEYAIYGVCHASNVFPPLTPKQFAGKEPLSRDNFPRQKVCLARFRNGYSTNGEWRIIETGGNSHNVIGDFEMPAGCRTLTVWVRHWAEGPTSGVAFDYISLEDLGPNDGQE